MSSSRVMRALAHALLRAGRTLDGSPHAKVLLTRPESLPRALRHEMRHARKTAAKQLQLQQRDSGPGAAEVSTQQGHSELMISLRAAEQELAHSAARILALHSQKTKARYVFDFFLAQLLRGGFYYRPSVTAGAGATVTAMVKDAFRGRGPVRQMQLLCGISDDQMIEPGLRLLRRLDDITKASNVLAEAGLYVSHSGSAQSCKHEQVTASSRQDPQRSNSSIAPEEQEPHNRLENQIVEQQQQYQNGSVLERGHLLVAHPMLDGPHGRSIVWLTNFVASDGAFGLVINSRPVGYVLISDVLRASQMDSKLPMYRADSMAHTDLNAREVLDVSWGGPVDDNGISQLGFRNFADEQGTGAAPSGSSQTTVDHRKHSNDSSHSRTWQVLRPDTMELSLKTQITLVHDRADLPGAVPIGNGMFAGCSDVRLLAERVTSGALQPGSNLFAFVGYSCWYPGQLEREVSENTWILARSGEPGSSASNHSQSLFASLVARQGEAGWAKASSQSSKTAPSAHSSALPDVASDTHVQEAEDSQAPHESSRGSESSPSAWTSVSPVDHEALDRVDLATAAVRKRMKSQIMKDELQKVQRLEHDWFSGSAAPSETQGISEQDSGTQPRPDGLPQSPDDALKKDRRQSSHHAHNQAPSGVGSSLVHNQLSNSQRDTPQNLREVSEPSSLTTSKDQKTTNLAGQSERALENLKEGAAVAPDWPVEAQIRWTKTHRFPVLRQIAWYRRGLEVGMRHAVASESDLEFDEQHRSTTARSNAGRASSQSTRESSVPVGGTEANGKPGKAQSLQPTAFDDEERSTSSGKEEMGSSAGPDWQGAGSDVADVALVTQPVGADSHELSEKQGHSEGSSKDHSGYERTELFGLAWNSLSPAETEVVEHASASSDPFSVPSSDLSPVLHYLRNTGMLRTRVPLEPSEMPGKVSLSEDGREWVVMRKLLYSERDTAYAASHGSEHPHGFAHASGDEDTEDDDLMSSAGEGESDDDHDMYETGDDHVLDRALRGRTSDEESDECSDGIEDGEDDVSDEDQDGNYIPSRSSSSAHHHVTSSSSSEHGRSRIYDYNGVRVFSFGETPDGRTISIARFPTGSNQSDGSDAEHDDEDDEDDGYHNIEDRADGRVWSDVLRALGGEYTAFASVPVIIARKVDE
ncbi:hypothetical protein FVE85_9495 [Porphyridium purpureum]|uniref:Uncharacterized protein n=1 Tax=Porphyridium purpureum TaxID=35688 RepID=A0A5J4YK09_PORPP|nr:hypothetical protein FVE85_9495 [Porphyridium purpureum]|eukprot:POR5141..scf261_15